MTVRRGWIAVTAVVAVTAMAATMAPAAAKPRPAPTPQQQAKIFDRMLTRADVPKSLRVSPGIEYTVKAHEGQHQSLCDKNGRDIQGRATDLLYQVELGETNTEKDPIAIEQKVWPYASAQQALREWQYIERQVQACSGRSEWRGETGNNNVQFLSHGRTTQRVDGRTGIWIWIDARGAVRNPESEDGGYYVLYLVKDTIQSVEYDYPDAKGLPFAARAQIDRLAWRLAERWLTTY
jgi:hypothetical protein